MLKRNEPLSLHTSFKIGGPANYWAEPGSLDDILEVVSLAKNKNKRLRVIGSGTNLLASDEGFDGVVVNVAGGFNKCEKENNSVIKAGAGLSAGKLVKYAFDEELGGCEFLTGVPGNIGGAVFMNAGVRSLEDTRRFNEIKDILIDIDILDLKTGEIKNLSAGDINFRYRYSGLDGNIILGARFGLKKNKKEDISRNIKEFSKKREWITGINFPNAGSIFKNPEPGKSAGMLIESCGLKGRRIGDAAISEVHANIIVNMAKATAKDVLSLIDLARKSVKLKFDIDLELELKIL